MALALADRLLTVAVTATVTSAAWVVLGTSYLGPDTAAPTPSESSPAEPAPSDTPVTPPPAGQAADLLIPVQGIEAGELADTFADARGGGGRLHEALDIIAPAGTPVLAAGPGTVEKLFKSDAGGNTVYVRSGDRRTIHYYAHLRDYAPGLKEGRRVRRGEALGTVGATGNADPAAPHLHFAILRTTPDAEWWEPATAANPYPLLTGK